MGDLHGVYGHPLRGNLAVRPFRSEEASPERVVLVRSAKRRLNTVPLVVGQRYNFHEVGCHLGNVG